VGTRCMRNVLLRAATGELSQGSIPLIFPLFLTMELSAFD